MGSSRGEGSVKDNSLQNFLDAIFLPEAERAGQIPGWEGGVVMSCILGILSWKLSLTSQTKICSSELWMRVLGWKWGYILKYINNELPFIDYFLCAKANHLLFNLICAGLHEKTDGPHVTDKEEEAQGERTVHALNHCVTLPPAEHLLSATFLENTRV